ncbi:hypothetical protein Drorol1_Dr00014501 [Drosera rotundifolia]
MDSFIRDRDLRIAIKAGIIVILLPLSANNTVPLPVKAGIELTLLPMLDETVKFMLMSSEPWVTLLMLKVSEAMSPRMNVRFFTGMVNNKIVKINQIHLFSSSAFDPPLSLLFSSVVIEPAHPPPLRRRLFPSSPPPDPPLLLRYHRARLSPSSPSPTLRRVRTNLEFDSSKFEMGFLRNRRGRRSAESRRGDRHQRREMERREVVRTPGGQAAAGCGEGEGDEDLGQTQRRRKGEIWARGEGILE